MSEQTIKKLIQRVSELESKMGEKPKEPKTPKAQRKPSEYNKFMSDYMAKNKNENKPHKELFIEATKAWGTSKK